MSFSLDAWMPHFDAPFLRVLASATCVNGRVMQKPGGALTAIEGPHGAVPADVMLTTGGTERVPNANML